MEFEEIQKKIKTLVEGPIQPIPDGTMAKIRKELAQKCPTSKKLFDEAKQNIPGGYEHQLLVSDPFVVTMKSAKGSKLWDVDSNEYVDWLSGAGAIILGHKYQPLRDKIVEVLQDCNPGMYYMNEYELKAVKLIKKYVPSIELFKFFQSGTEADMAAIRVARTYTKKKKIIKIGGGYHGWSDQMVYDTHVPGSGDLEAHGIPRHCFKDIVSVWPNDLEMLEQKFKDFEKKKGIAGVIVEPMGPESGNIPVAPDFNKGVEELCQKYGALLIFDEVVTGFRMGMGGAQKYFGVKPDLTAFGKLLTHGYPSTGGLGGRADIMNYFASGIEAGQEKVMASGTLLGNPITTAATYYGLQFMEKENAADKAAKMGDTFVAKMNDLFESHGVPYFAYNFRSIVQYKTYAAINTDIRIPGNVEKAIYRNDMVGRIASAMLSQGIITKRGASGFATMAHTDEDLEKFVQAFDTVLKLIPH